MNSFSEAKFGEGEQTFTLEVAFGFKMVRNICSRCWRSLRVTPAILEHTLTDLPRLLLFLTQGEWQIIDDENEELP